MNKQIVDEVQKLCSEIVANYYAMNLQASKRFANETVVEEEGSHVRIVSPSYVYQMEGGRAAGTMPPVSAIRQWIRDKNANAGTNIPEEAAFAIAYTIKKEGIKVPNPFNDGGVVSRILDANAVQRITLSVLDIVKAELLTILKK